MWCKFGAAFFVSQFLSMNEVPGTEMEGQWVGEVSGDSVGNAVLNVEKIQENYLGKIIFFDQNYIFPNLVFALTIKKYINKKFDDFVKREKGLSC